MSQTERVRRASVVGLVALALAAGVAFPASAQNPPAEPKVSVLPEPLTKESVRELVARLSDDEVRKLLLDQLDRAAAAALVPGKAEAGMAGMVEHNAGMMRGQVAALNDALIGLPSTMRNVGAKLTEPDGPSRLLFIAGLLAAMLVAGWLAEKVFDRTLRHYRAGLRQTAADTFTANAFRLAVGLLLDLAGIAVFGLAALATFFVMWHEHDLQRTAILSVLIAVVIVRVVALFARFLLAPESASARLLPFADAPARHLRRFVVAFAAIFGVDVAVISVLRGSGANAATIDLVAIGTAGLYIAIALTTVWRVRVPVAGLIRGDGRHGAIVGWLADLWPVIATAYFVGIVVGRVSDILSGNAGMTGVGLLSVLLVVALPIVDMALCRAVAAAATGAPKGDAVPVRGIVADYEQVFRRAIHIVVVVVGLLIFAHLWDLDVFALAQKSMGGKISSSLLGVSIVLLLTYMIWEAAKTAIDRRLQAEGELDPEVPKSRLRTLLPLLRATILVTIVVMATMSVLAALGVDILPLLAGASVVGVAIGFGSQTLIRDIVSGAFS
jgi:small-conductance mechanosensitive channel